MAKLVKPTKTRPSTASTLNDSLAASTISVIGRDDNGGPERSGSIKAADVRVRRGDISAQELKERIEHFLRGAETMLQGVPNRLGAFSVETLALSIEISAKGSISLLGTGGEWAGKGGLTLTLKKTP